jgi:hypothetical protein
VRGGRGEGDQTKSSWVACGVIVVCTVCAVVWLTKWPGSHFVEKCYALAVSE